MILGVGRKAMTRRDFTALLGSVTALAIAWPLTVHAQQPVMPVIGYLSTSFPNAAWVAAFRQGLKEAGYIEGQNVAIEFRWAEGQYDRLPGLATDLVARQVAVIAALGHPAALAAKKATAAIPIVFMSTVDPVAYGLVDSIERPAGNATGAYLVTLSLEAKRLELLRLVFPNATRVAVLVNPTNPAAEQQLKDSQEAARALGIELRIANASSEPSINTVFSTLVEQRIGALLVTTDSFFVFRRDQLVALAARYSMPAMYSYREFAVAGGLMSYGVSLIDGARLAGVYAGRVLKGKKPTDLPVQQSTKVELVINLKAAKALGVTFPATLLGSADEVIE